jgi:hypothetical protein
MNTLYFLCAVLSADPLVQLPPTLQAKPGRLVQIAAKSEQKLVKWFLIGQDADLIVMESSKSAIFSASNAGEYRVLAWTASSDVPSDAAVCVIRVGESPAPAPPAPEDPLQSALQAIYGGIQDPQKNEQRQTLAKVYRQAAEAAGDPKWRTAGELYNAIRGISVKALPDDALRPIRDRLGDEVATILPTDAAAPLTDEIRKKSVNFYQRAANILESLR